MIKNAVGLRKLVSNLVLILLIGSCASPMVVNTNYVHNHEVHSLKSEYSQKLQVSRDSIKHLTLYRTINKWPDYVSNDSLKQHAYNPRFIQFLYYLTYNEKIPGTVNEIYDSEQTFLYRNTAYLSEGNLVFFKYKNQAKKHVGFYLKNKYFVMSDKKGALKFYHLKDSLTTFNIVANAKIKRNVAP